MNSTRKRWNEIGAVRFRCDSWLRPFRIEVLQVVSVNRSWLTMHTRDKVNGDTLPEDPMTAITRAVVRAYEDCDWAFRSFINQKTTKAKYEVFLDRRDRFVEWAILNGCKAVAAALDEAKRLESVDTGPLPEAARELTWLADKIEGKVKP